jgi:quinohemoprotein ethanol dehydrogenase
MHNGASLSVTGNGGMRSHREATIIAVSLLAVALAALLLAACGRNSAPPPPAAPATGSTPAARLDAGRLSRDASEPEQWFTSGRDGAGTYYSPLKHISADNVARLGYAWQFVLDTSRGLEATPIVIDGVMYAVGNWGRVYALDARSGRELWRRVPPVDGQWARHACCDVVNRGLAVWQGRVYVGTIDGWLEALDAATGAVVWRVDTLLGRDRRLPYTVSGAPLIAGDVVVIGNGGADFGVRGYVSAYDLSSGALKWRFFTVPRDPALGPQDQPHLDKAARSWDPHGAWQYGGGGTVWDGMAYDPELKLVYLGTGNASPYDARIRSPRGGDNLYLASIVAVHAESGALAWYYQQVPAERWDYTATMKMILADLQIGGRTRRVLMQAPKNGFFYVLDRATGELLSAKNFTFVNWTKGIDPKSGRPIPNPAADYAGTAKLVFPSQAGAHNWQPMSYDAATGLVYIPVIDMPMVYIDTRRRPAGLVEGAFTVPGIPPEGYDPAGMRSLFGPLPALSELARQAGAPAQSRGELRAWDPVRQRVVWSQPGVSFWDGGVMSTGGGLVFRGDAAGFLNVYAAADGRLLRRVEVGTSIMAAPMTYSVAGEQYVAVMAGYGGGGGFAFPPDSAAFKYGNQGRIIALRLGGGAVPLPPPVRESPLPQPPEPEPDAAAVARGEVLYNRYCGRCHLFGRGLLPDLRRMSPATHAIFPDIVLRGAYVSKGMARWDDVLTLADAAAIHDYIVSQARAQWRQEHPAAN